MRPIYSVVENILTDDECDLIIKEQSPSLEQAGFNNQENMFFPALKRNSKISWIRQGSKLDSLIHKLLFVMSDVAYKQHGVTVNWFEPVQFTEYKILGRYGYHHDVSPNTSDPCRLISASVELSPSSYIGGGLAFDIDTNVPDPPKKRGSMVVFPSILKHKAKTVWLGKRCSLVLWGHYKPGDSQ